ncbi:MAG: DUF2306 domain-containing protein [Hyphomonadaceae bacterium]|nr:DUF2306 domain-containing protein [Hyphomonadaceae bacterium]
MVRNRIPLIAWGATAAILAAAIGPSLGRLAQVKVSPHWPDAALWAGEPLKVQVHVLAAATALAIGSAIMLKPKGTGFHRTLGWAWTVAMAATAISSLFITDLNDGALSVLHLFSGWTIVALPLGIAAIRRKGVRTHRGVMTGLFLGGLVLAGALTFLPGRLMWRLFLG